MRASKYFPITDHPRIPCGCGDPDCGYCGECMEQECFHQYQPAAPSGLRDVSIDEVFTWREEFGQKAREAFGGPNCDVSPRTYSDLKSRCDRLEREVDPFFERGNLSSAPVPLGGIKIHMVKQGEVPDGVLRACACGKKKAVLNP